jgi:hypothetical protein
MTRPALRLVPDPKPLSTPEQWRARFQASDEKMGSLIKAGMPHYDLSEHDERRSRKRRCLRFDLEECASWLRERGRC